MSHCCSQCGFTSQFESALTMHHQLHHEPATHNGYVEKPKVLAVNLTKKANTVSRASLEASFSESKESKGLKLPGRTSSATRLFEKLRCRITRSRSRMLFSHPEETCDNTINDLSATSECTSKDMVKDAVTKSSAFLTSLDDPSQTYGCHLCAFVADRITVLDRHLLNHHKIGLENLLKLVMAKTKDGLSEECTNSYGINIRQPYYKATHEIIDEGEFVIETVTPKIKILKHASTNTELLWTDLPDLKDNCRKITSELEKLINEPTDNVDKHGFLTKMQTLSECMCKFVDSTNTLKKILAKGFDSKTSVRDRLSIAEPFFELGLGDQDTPRDWERAHSEKLERTRHKHGDSCGGGKPKLSSDSFYF